MLNSWDFHKEKGKYVKTRLSSSVSSSRSAWKPNRRKKFPSEVLDRVFCASVVLVLVQTNLKVRGFIRGICRTGSGPDRTAELKRTTHTVQRSKVGSGPGSDRLRPRVFWVITGFGIPSAGRGHVVETGVLEPVPRWGPILLLSIVFILHHSLARCSLPPIHHSVCWYLSKPNRSSLGIHSWLFFILSLRSFIFSFPPRSVVLIWHIVSCCCLRTHKASLHAFRGNSCGYLHCLDCQTKNASITKFYERRPANLNTSDYILDLNGKWKEEKMCGKSQSSRISIGTVTCLMGGRGGRREERGRKEKEERRNRKCLGDEEYIYRSSWLSRLAGLPHFLPQAGHFLLLCGLAQTCQIVCVCAFSLWFYRMFVLTCNSN